MYHFLNDYSEGCHPQVLEALTLTNMESTSGYGTDEYCAAARNHIRELIGCPTADVHFLVGGTQANMTAISAFLRGHEAPLAAESAHINTHETGAVEATGHKILTHPAPDGKLTPNMIEEMYQKQTDEHVVKPALVYISQSTEYGTVYMLSELRAISEACRKLGLFLFLDGARLACGIAASDITFPDLAEYCDAFYIGGTKNGALFGEALVIINDRLKPDFRYYIKRHGGMLAKGRLLGVQFDALLRDGLYLQLGKHSNDMAQKIQTAMEKLGVQMYVHSPTNQIFPIVTNDQMEALKHICTFELNTQIDEKHTAIRFVCSWATKESDVESFISELNNIF